MKILSLDGGGYLGLTTASFIEEVERHFGRKFHTEFDMFCGTSTGAIIALALAAGLDGQQIRMMYEDFGPKVFNNLFPGHRLMRQGASLVSTMYNNGHLQKSLAAALGGKTLGDINKSGKRVLVTSFCLTTGSPRIFKTNHGPELTKHSQIPLHRIALASSAAPVYLPIVEITDPETGMIEQFCDGGVFANSPGLLGFTEALAHCNVPAAEVKLLSLATPRANLAEHKSARFMTSTLNRSALSWGLGSLSSVMIDGTSEINDQALRRLVKQSPGAVYERVTFGLPSGTGMDIATKMASETLRQVGVQAASDGVVRDRMKFFFN